MVLFGKQSTKRMIKRHSQFPVKQWYMYVCLYFADISLTLKQNIKTVVIVISVESMRRCKRHCCDKSLKYLKMRCRVFKFLGGLACDFLPKKKHSIVCYLQPLCRCLPFEKTAKVSLHIPPSCSS